jgi:hypothetical protein
MFAVLVVALGSWIYVEFLPEMERLPEAFLAVANQNEWVFGVVKSAIMFGFTWFMIRPFRRRRIERENRANQSL